MKRRTGAGWGPSGGRLRRCRAGKVAGDRLVEHRQGQVHRRRAQELAHRHDLAARNPGQVGDDALDLLDVLPREPGLGLLQGGDAAIDPVTGIGLLVLGLHGALLARFDV